MRAPATHLESKRKSREHLIPAAQLIATAAGPCVVLTRSVLGLWFRNRPAKISQVCDRAAIALENDFASPGDFAQSVMT